MEVHQQQNLEGAKGQVCHLANCGLFKDCSESFLYALELSLDVRLYFPGEEIVRENEPGDSMFILNRGIVSVEIEGREIRIQGGNEHYFSADPKELRDQEGRSGSKAATSITSVR